MTSEKPIICWMCDEENWAFFYRAKRLANYLSDYEHDIMPLKGIVLEEKTERILKADIVVCDFLPWLFPIEDFSSKVVLGLRSFRALEVTEQLLCQSEKK